MRSDDKRHIAVLALQGAFVEHEAMLARLGTESFQVRCLEDWQRPHDGLIIPGGESTSQTKLLRETSLMEPIRRAILDGLPVLATCAGLIMLAKEEDGQAHQGLATMDIDVCRNAYGRQLGSFHAIGAVEEVGPDIPMTFIRAPYVHRTLSPLAHVLSTVDGHIVAVRQGRQLATAFHPELTDDLRLHAYWLRLIG